MYAAIISTSSADGAHEDNTEADSVLETGIIREGCASSPVGESWFDTSAGPSYGDGERYQFQETNNITRVRSKNR